LSIAKGCSGDNHIPWLAGFSNLHGQCNQARDASQLSSFKREGLSRRHHEEVQRSTYRPSALHLPLVPELASGQEPNEINPVWPRHRTGRRKFRPIEWTMWNERICLGLYDKWALTRYRLRLIGGRRYLRLTRLNPGFLR